MHIGTEEHEKNTIAPACVTWIKKINKKKYLQMPGKRKKYIF